MTKYLRTVNFTAKDKINVVSAKSLREAKDAMLTITGVALTEDVNAEDGVVTPAGFIKTIDNEYYSTISNTCLQALDGIADLIEDDPDCKDGVTIGMEERTSGNKRKYLVIKLV